MNKKLKRSRGTGTKTHSLGVSKLLSELRGVLLNDSEERSLTLRGKLSLVLIEGLGVIRLLLRLGNDYRGLRNRGRGLDLGLDVILDSTKVELTSSTASNASSNLAIARFVTILLTVAASVRNGLVTVSSEGSAPA